MSDNDPAALHAALQAGILVAYRDLGRVLRGLPVPVDLQHQRSREVDLEAAHADAARTYACLVDEPMSKASVHLVRKALAHWLGAADLWRLYGKNPEPWQVGAISAALNAHASSMAAIRLEKRMRNGD